MRQVDAVGDPIVGATGDSGNLPGDNSALSALRLLRISEHCQRPYNFPLRRSVGCRIAAQLGLQAARTEGGTVVHSEARI